MKFVCLLWFLIIYVADLPAQHLYVKPEKPLIDTTHFHKWLTVKPTLTDAKVTISSDGRYALYKIQESWSLPATLIVQAINADPKATGWKIELNGIDNAVFTEDSRKAFFIQSDDSLYVLTLGSSSKEFIARVNGFRLFKQAETEWLAYRSNTADTELILRNLETGKEQSFPNVSDYLLSRDGNTLVLKTGSGKSGGISQSLSWINLSNGSRKLIWEGDNASNFVLDDNGFQLAFKSEYRLNDQTGISFWYYKDGTNNAVQVINNQSTDLDTGLQLSNILKFDKNRSKLFINLKEKDAVKPDPGAVKVDVWRYADARLQSQQLNELWPKSYVAVLDINDKGITHIQLDNDVVSFGMDELGDSLVLINSREGEYGEWNWNKTAIPSFYLVNTSTGERKEVPIENPQISLNKKYIIGISRGMTDIYSYEIAKGTTRNLTGSLPIPVGGVEFDQPYISKSRGLQIVARTANKESIIVYDEFDIWQLDPSGRQAPINLTNGYGRKNKIEFRLAGMYSGKDIPNKEELILLAFNNNNKNSGFYRIVMDEKINPELLSMGPYYYEPGYKGACQIKARDADIYIVMRETAAESPNYFWTKDFKLFIPLSAVYPEKKYSWLTSELISFKTLDGRSEQAVVYKPENFDPKKKYPVVLHYYDRMTQQLNRYTKPGGYAHLDIPWFVSHGYIVVTPDIHYRIGETGKSAYNTVAGAAKYLTRFSWIDAKHIGLQGHSFGGYQTNYIVTQTNLFAAAVSSSGMSDFVSNYLGFLGSHANHDWYENRICRIGATLWEKPDLYIRNSPVFYADKVTTPLLTVANKRDGNVRFEQGLEWFTALRRLGKKIWMLQYDEADHALDPKEYKDYVIRTAQFFDHYLKGAPAPKWMTRGIPAKMKGIDDGLELDHDIKTPGEGLLTTDQKKKVEALKNKKPVTIILD